MKTQKAMHAGEQSTANVGAVLSFDEATSGARVVYANAPPYPSSVGAPQTVKFVLTPVTDRSSTSAGRFPYAFVLRPDGVPSRRQSSRGSVEESKANVRRYESPGSFPEPQEVAITLGRTRPEGHAGTPRTSRRCSVTGESRENCRTVEP